MTKHTQGITPEHDPSPPEGCRCGALWTVRGKHGKKDCPYYIPTVNEYLADKAHNKVFRDNHKNSKDSSSELRAGIIRLLKAVTAKVAREPLAYVNDFLTLVAAHDNALYQRVVEEVIGLNQTGYRRADGTWSHDYSRRQIIENELRDEQRQVLARIFGKGE